MNKLEATSGKWVVFTEASSYFLDLDEMTFIRQPGAGKGPDPDVPGFPLVSQLRRDGELIQLIGVITCEVGHFLELLAADIEPQVTTYRRGTVVREIKEMKESLVEIEEQ